MPTGSLLISLLPANSLKVGYLRDVMQLRSGLWGWYRPVPVYYQSYGAVYEGTSITYLVFFRLLPRLYRVIAPSSYLSSRLTPLPGLNHMDQLPPATDNKYSAFEGAVLAHLSELIIQKIRPSRLEQEKATWKG